MSELFASGGIFAAVVGAIAVIVGWLNTRQSTTSSTQEWLLREMRLSLETAEDSRDDALAKIRERDAQIAGLEEHVARCDRDNETLRRRQDAMVATLRGVLTVEQMDNLLSKIDDEHGDDL